MKNILIFGLLILMLAIAACGTKSEDPNPDPNPNPNPDPDPTPVSYAEIGHYGGVLEYEGFKMEVPEGCFNGYFRVNLALNEAQTIYGDKEASTFYTLSGLPVELLEPVQVTIESSSAEELFAVVGQEVKATSNSASGMSFQFLDLVKEGNKFQFTLDITDIPNYATDDTTEFVLGLVKGYVKLENKGNFVVYAPTTYANEALSLQQYLEEAYSVFNGAALNFVYTKRTKWPVQVTVRKLDAGTFGYFTPSKWGDNYGYMEFNEDKLTDPAELRLTAGHEFFHLVQALYDPRYGFNKAISPSDYYWVEEASSVWAEAMFSANPLDYCSSIRNGHQMAPFAGMIKGAEENPQHHGYGMSALIKYIANRFGDEKLVKVFESEQNGNTDIVSAFNSALSDPLSSYYPDFIDQYSQGYIYSDMGPASLLSGLSGTFSVNNANDTLKIFESSYPGLSAKIYKIDINYTGFDDRNSLTLKTYEGTKKLIYKLKGSEMTLLGTAFGDYVITDLPTFQQENALILVVVVQQYYTDLTEKLEMKINTTPPLNIISGKFALKNVPCLEEIYYINTGTTTTQDVNYSYTYDDDEFVPCTYVNGNYYASWETNPAGGFRHIGSMHLVIDEQNRKIVTGTITARIEAVSNPENYYYWLELELKDIPGTSWGTNSVWFAISGSDFCNPTFVPHFDEASASSPSANRRTLLSYSCSSNTSLVIKLNLQP